MTQEVGSVGYGVELSATDTGLLKTLQSVQKAMESLDKSVNSLATKMDKSFDSIGQSASKASSTTSSSMKKVERAITPTIATLDRLRDKYAQVAKSSDQIGNATGNLDRVQKAYQSYVNQVESGFSSTEKMTAATARLNREMTRAQQENTKYQSAMNAVEKSVISAERRVSTLTSRMKSFGDSEKPVNELTQALQRYRTQMTDAAGDTVATARAQANFANATDEAKREISEMSDRLRRYTRETEAARRGTGNLSASMGALIASTGAFVSAYNAIEILRMADQYTEMANRLAVVSMETANVAEQMRTLLGVAIDARSSLDGVTDVYSKLTRANERYGKSQEEILSITTAVSQAVSMSGATAQGAQGALIQFSQAISNNFQAAAQEINSINEQTPALSQAIALALTSTGKYGEVAASDLKRLASEGRLSAGDLLDGFVNVADQIEERFNQATLTMAQGFVALKDSAVTSLGEVGRATGITETIAKTMQDLAKSSEQSAAGIAGVGAALGTMAAAIGVAGIVGLFAIMGPAATTIAAVGVAVSALAGIFVKEQAKVALFEQRMEDLRDGVEATRNSMFGLTDDKYSWEDSSFSAWLQNSNDAIDDSRNRISELEKDITNLVSNGGGLFDQVLANLGASIGIDLGVRAQQAEIENRRTERQIELEKERALLLEQAVELAQRFNDARFGNLDRDMNEALAAITRENDAQLIAISSVKSAAEDYYRFVTNNADKDLLDIRRAQIAEGLIRDLGFEADNIGVVIDSNKDVIDGALIMMAQGFASTEEVVAYLNNNLDTNAELVAKSEEEIQRLYEGMDNAVGATARFSAEIARLGQIMMAAAAVGNTEMVDSIRAIIIEMNKQYNTELKNINKAGEGRKKSEKSIDSLVSSYQNMNDVLQQQAELSRNGIEGVMNLQALQKEEAAVRDIQKAIGELSSSELQKFVKQSGIVVQAGESVEDAMVRMSRETSNFQDQLKEQEDANKNVTKGFEDLVKEYEEANAGLVSITLGTEAYNRAIADLEISRSVNEITEEFNKLNAVDQARQIAILSEALGLVGVTAENLPQKLTEAFKGIDQANRELERSMEIAELAEKEAQRFEDAFMKGIENVAQTFKDGLFDMEDGFSGFADSLKDSFKDLLADLAYEAFLRPIVVGFQSDVRGMIGGQGGGSGGFSNALGAAKNIFSGGLGGIQWTGAGGAQAYGGSGFANAATSGTGVTGFMGGSLQNFAGLQGLASAGTGALGGMAGTKVGSSLFGKEANSSIGSTVGALGGTFLGGPVGAAVGGFVGGALDSLFGSKGTPFFGSVGTSGNRNDIQEYKTDTALGTTGFTKVQRVEKATSEGTQEWAANLFEASKALDSVIASTARSSSELDSMKEAVNAFGASSGNASHLIKAQLVDRTLVALEAAGHDVMTAWGSLNAEELASRVEVASNSLALLSSTSKQLNIQFDATSSKALIAAENMAQLAGGVDQLASLQESYYQSFFTEAEKAASLQRDLGKAMAEMGMVLPSTREGFRQLVEQQNQMTESGQRNYVQLLQLAGSFDQLQTYLESTGDAVDKFADELQEAKDAVSNAESDVKDAFQTFIDQAFDIELGLLQVAGDEMGALTLQRERELQTIDESLRPFQERLWALQDEKAAQEEAKKASESYASSLSSIQGELTNTLKSISQWVDAEMASGGSPVNNLSEATKQFEEQLKKAQGGDRTALGNITQYADRLLGAGEGMFASGKGFQDIRDDVLKELQALPDAISDAEFIVNGFRDVISNELASEIERAIFDSQYKIDALIDFAADATALPEDLRTILGKQAHQLRSTIEYVLGSNPLSPDMIELALRTSNNLVSTIDYIARKQLTEAEKRLALNSSNLMVASLDYVIRKDLDEDSRKIALESINRYSAVVDMILGSDISEASRKLALESSNLYATTVDFLLRKDLSRDNRILALAGGSAYETLMSYVVAEHLNEDEKRIALENANKYLTTLRFVVSQGLDDVSERLAIESTNRYLSTISFAMGKDISQADRKLALDSGNRYLTNIEQFVSKKLSDDDRRLALQSNNRYVSVIDTVVGKALTGGDRRLALGSTNSYLTIVDAVMKNGISADTRNLALRSSNSLLATVDGVLSSKLPKDVRDLALKSSNRLLTKLEVALQDGKLSSDERKVLDAESSKIVKTLVASGSLNLTKDQKAVIEAASGVRQLELLADVAFAPKDLKELENIEGNTKSTADKALDQIKELNKLVSEMTNTTDQFVTLNSTMLSLRDSINALGVAQAEVARIEREQAVKKIEAQARVVTDRLSSTWDARSGALSEIKTIENWGKGKDIDRLRPIAEQDTGQGVSGWHQNTDGKYRNWKGWEPYFNKLTGQLRGSALEDMTDKQFSDWLSSEKKKHDPGTWGAHYIEVLARRIRAQELVAKAERDNAYKESLYNQLPGYTGSIDVYQQQLDDLRKEYEELAGSAPPFAKGGVFTNSIVSTPTYFDMGLMGEAGPEAIMPLTRGPGGSLGVMSYGGSDGISELIAAQIISSNNSVSDEIYQLRQDLNSRLDKNNEQNEESNAIDREGYTLSVSQLRELISVLSEMEDMNMLAKRRD